MKKIFNEGFLQKTIAIIIILCMHSFAYSQPVKKGYAPVNGLKMYYEIYGEGKPLVLLHGAWTHSRY